MTQHQDLQLLRALAAREQYDQPEQPAGDDVDNRHDQERPPKDGPPTLPRHHQAAPPQPRRPLTDFRTPRNKGTPRRRVTLSCAQGLPLATTSRAPHFDA